MSSPPAAPDARSDTLRIPADYETTLRFLDFLFEGAATGFVEFRILSPDRKRKMIGSPIILPLPLSHNRLAAEVVNHSVVSGEISFGPAPRFRAPVRGRAGKAHDVLQVGCIWVVLEHGRAPGGAIEVMRRIRNFPLRPSVTVNSGLSHYLYFAFFDQLCDLQLLEWDDLARELGDLLSGRPPESIGQTLPLPGGVNLSGGMVLPCGISEEFSSWSRFSLDEISAALRGAARAWSSADASVSDSIGRAYQVESLRGRGLDTDTIEAIITGRVPALRVRGPATAGGEAGRDFQVAFTLFEKGFSLEEVKSVFRAHPQGCGSRWARLKEGERYLDSLFAKVTTRYGELKNYVLGGGSPEGDWVGSYKLPPGYMEHEDGSVWFQPPVKDEGRRSPALIKVSDSPIHITEIKESIDTGQIMMTLSFDYLGRTISESIPRSFMSNPRQLAGALSGLGAPVTSLNARTVTAYLTAYERHFAPSLPHKKVTSRFGRGRADGPFYLPGVAAGVEFVPAAAGDASLHRAYASRRGSLRGWLEVMRAVARETLMIPQAAVLASLVPPLQRRLRIPNFVLDLHGNTSTGKSTSLRMAASVYGRPTDPDSLVFQWMSTAAAVEQVAATCSELPVFLDDAQHCPAALKRSLIYMIANGRGKGRGERGGGGFGETLTWHTVALSTSEEPLQEASPHEGARGRLLPVGGSVPPFRAGMASLVSEVEKGIVANHGHVGEAYIRRLNGWAAEDWRRWQARYHEIRGGLLRHVSSNLAGRVSGYVAAIQLAAEVACPVIGLPFKPDAVGAWLMLHLDEQQNTQNVIMQALRALADYYVAHINQFAGDGRYSPERRVNLLGTSQRHEYVGFLRSTVDAAFKAHRWNQTAMLNKLSEAGTLHGAEKDRHTKKVSIEGVKHRMVCIKWSTLFPDDSRAP